MNRFKLYAKRAGAVALGLLLLDLAATAAAVALGAEFLKR
jgi:hypothetical protein